jgi:hypothetical protein
MISVIATVLLIACPIAFNTISFTRFSCVEELVRFIVRVQLGDKVHAMN